jgi:hypothetical protein
MTIKPVVFLSYSDKDKAFLDELKAHLKAIQQRTEFDLWDDSHVVATDEWHEKIKATISYASIAILLISPDYLASDWISKEELPFILEQQSTRGLRIFPVILRPAPWAHTPLAYFQVWPRDGSALSTFQGAERDKLLVSFVEEVSAALFRLQKKDFLLKDSVLAMDRLSVQESISIQGEPVGEDFLLKRQPSLLPRFFISHAKEDGDFAENLKFRLEKEGFIGWIDIDVLEAGVDWRKEIDDAILKSRGLILVLSPDSKASEYVTYEWAFALGSGRSLVPLMLKDTPVHPRLEIFQYLDFTNRRARPWDKLFSRLKHME